MNILEYNGDDHKDIRVCCHTEYGYLWWPETNTQGDNLCSRLIIKMKVT